MNYKKPKYFIVDSKGELILCSNVLSELLSTIILETLKKIEREKSLLYRINKNYFEYFTVLTTIYKNCEYFTWSNIKSVEMVFNNSHFVKKEEFIYFKRNKFELNNLKQELNVINWRVYRKK